MKKVSGLSAKQKAKDKNMVSFRAKPDVAELLSQAEEISGSDRTRLVEECIRRCVMALADEIHKARTLAREKILGSGSGGSTPPTPQDPDPEAPMRVWKRKGGTIHESKTTLNGPKFRPS